MSRRSLHLFRLLVLLALCWAGAGRAETSLRQEIERDYLAARRAWETDRTNLLVQIRYGETAFAWGDTVNTSSERELVAEAAVSALRLAVRDHPKSAAAHYYLAMNLGQLARTRTLGALSLVREMEKEFKAAIELDPTIHFSGPERNLGQLYHFAPGWPMSLGDTAESRRYLESAVKRHPDFPANRLSFIELLVSTRDLAEARRQMETVDAGWDAARKHWSGREWEDDWEEWTELRARLKKHLAGMAKAPVPPKLAK